MNRRSSVLWLMIQSSFSKILMLLAGVSAVQLALFVWAFRELSWVDYGLEQVLSQSHVAKVAAVGFLGMTWLLVQTGSQHGSRIGYTLQRLSVSEREVFWWQTLYNGGCYLILWAAQVLTMLGLGVLYTKMADPSMVTSQTILLACYRSRYLSSLLPLVYQSRWLRMGCLLVGLALASSYYPYAKRRGEAGNELVTLAVLAAFMFSESTYGMYSLGGLRRFLAGPWFLAIVSLVVTAMVLWQVLRKEAGHGKE